MTTLKTETGYTWQLSSFSSSWMMWTLYRVVVDEWKLTENHLCCRYLIRWCLQWKETPSGQWHDRRWWADVDDLILFAAAAHKSPFDMKLYIWTLAEFLFPFGLTVFYKQPLLPMKTAEDFIFKKQFCKRNAWTREVAGPESFPTVSPTL